MVRFDCLLSCLLVFYGIIWRVLLKLNFITDSLLTNETKLLSLQESETKCTLPNATLLSVLYFIDKTHFQANGFFQIFNFETVKRVYLAKIYSCNIFTLKFENSFTLTPVLSLGK